MAVTIPGLGEPETPVIIVGGGPVGLLTAYELSRLEIPSILAEQSLETTKWPKVDLINSRSMEILRMWGLADELRSQEGAVGDDFKFDSIFYTTMAEGGSLLTSWSLPSVKEWRQDIAENNDGSQPAEPGQRCSQIVFERWMKQKCQEQPLIDARSGLKFISFTEDNRGVSAIFEDKTGQKQSIRGKYLVGCDGGGSSVRKCAGITMVGEPLPVTLFLVHFRSKEFANLRPFGRFWRAFPPNGGFMIDQDEGDTFTVHQIIDPDTDVSKIDPYEIIYRVLGGTSTPMHIGVDEILVSGAWQPKVCMADSYQSRGGRVFLAGDAAHSTPPHSSYSMNTGVEDALALSWRLSAVLHGYGGPHLLSTYTAEQRPMMFQRLKRSQQYVLGHPPRVALGAETPGLLLDEPTLAGVSLGMNLAAYFDASASEYLDTGIELDFRHKSPAIIQDRDASAEPVWDLRRYTPSTYPGSRAPHLFLHAGDGKTSIFDLYGKGWTLVHFFDPKDPYANTVPNLFICVAKKLKLPLKVVSLSKAKESLARSLWECDLVLVRPDGHVAWRCAAASDLCADRSRPCEERVKDVIEVVLGWKLLDGYVAPEELDVALAIEAVRRIRRSGDVTWGFGKY